MSENLSVQTENLISKIHHYLITNMGVTADEATEGEFYRAFCMVIREEIMINWTATNHTFLQSKARKVFYLSFEYMPGRLLGNNITNISATDLMKSVLKKMGRDLNAILNYEPDIGIGNGGLGRLASCFLDSLATQKYPAMGYGMRYQYGIFEQDLWCGVQIERPDCWLLTENPWEFRRDTSAVSVKFAGKLAAAKNNHGEEVFNLVDAEEVRALPFDIPILGYSTDSDFSVLTLRLWSTKESPRNFQLQKFNLGQLDEASENTSLTDVLYPNDNNEMGKRMRLKQEFLFVSASLKDILNNYLETFKDFKDFANSVRIQINDTHPALVVAELMRLLTKRHELKWKEAWDITSACIGYTNHTVLKEALEEWNIHRVNYLLPRQYKIIERLNAAFLQDIRNKFPHDEDKVRRMSMFEGDQIKMAHLAIYGAHKVNGVAHLHSEILKHVIFKDFYEMYPDKFVNVTNGVTQRRWLLLCNPLLAEFIKERIGDKWITEFHEIKKIAQFADDPESRKAFLEIKKKNKKRLIDHIFQIEMLRQGNIGKNIFPDEEALFDVQIKRIHEYKRQLLSALHCLILYQELKENPESRKIKRFVLFGGKAAPGYMIAKSIIRFIYLLSKKIDNDPAINKKLKIYFFPNYNVSNAQAIIPAADISEQISTAGMEASGTGNMKLSINGALTIATEDGANIEMRESITDKWWPFRFGSTADENKKMLQERSYNSWDQYNNYPYIKKAIDYIKNGELAENDAEKEVLHVIYRILMEGSHGGFPDRYFVLKDLPAYYETHKKAEELYLDRERWAEHTLHNIAGMGPFSTDVSIKNYAEKIWGIKPCPIDKNELERIRDEYRQYDRCRILGKVS